MEKLVLQTGAGDRFSDVAKEAKERAERHELVEFVFNDITCLVNKETVLEWLEREYSDAFIMDWKTIGPKCRMDYDVDTKIELYTRRLERAKQQKERELQQDKEEKEQKEYLDATLMGIELEIIPGKEKEYSEYVANNSKDGYSKAVIDYGEGWAKLMQIEIAKGKQVKDIADETQKPVSFLGITGFQYGCVVQGLAHFWKHGEDLRKWHNKEYGVSEDKAGVVNPAVLTITT